MSNTEKPLLAAKAQSVWSEMSASEQMAARFGLLPSRQLQAAQAEGYDLQELTLAIFAVAKSQGGMVS